MRKYYLFVFIPIFFLFIYFLHVPFTFADTATPSATNSSNTNSSSAVTGDWVPDATVTFLGQTASRSAGFVNTILGNYQWEYQNTPLLSAWVFVRNIVYALLFVVVLIAAFIIIISGGTNITALIFTKKFILILLLISFSFALVQLLYQIVDILQGFFLHGAGPTIIGSKDLISMGFGYNFSGFRILGQQYNESAFISLLLVQLTAVTFYVMGSILIVRKIILWFFIIASPIYPLVLLYFPIRNSAKIWISEFFRWLLYAPIFTLLLLAIVDIWRANINILPFNFTIPAVLYPTSVSILLGGPGQLLSSVNSLNYSDTFSQYVIALLMLWVAMLLPFALLQVFLDYVGKASFMNTLPQYISTIRDNFVKPISSGKIPPQPPSGVQPTGAAKTIGNETLFRSKQLKENIEKILNEVTENEKTSSSFVKTDSAQIPQQHTWSVPSQVMQQVGDRAVTQTQHVIQAIQSVVHLKPEMAQKQSLKLLTFSIPTMQDIAQFETARLAKASTQTHQFVGIQDTLQKIANPALLTSLVEKQKYASLKEKLSQETTKGDPLAKSVLSAATMVSSTQTKPPIELPAINQIQTVSIDDYDQVKDLWVDNYTNIDISGTDTLESRQQWIQNDITALTTTLNLLNSGDNQKIQQGLQSVSSILPFILIGGFSQTEVTAYLKAKLEAGKVVLKVLSEKKEEEATLVTVDNVKKEKPKELSVAEEKTTY